MSDHSGATLETPTYHPRQSWLGPKPLLKGWLQRVLEDSLHTLLHAVMPGLLEQQHNNLTGCLQGTWNKGTPRLLNPQSLHMVVWGLPSKPSAPGVSLSVWSPGQATGPMPSMSHRVSVLLLGILTISHSR